MINSSSHNNSNAPRINLFFEYSIILGIKGEKFTSKTTLVFFESDHTLLVVTNVPSSTFTHKT